MILFVTDRCSILVKYAVYSVLRIHAIDSTIDQVNLNVRMPSLERELNTSMYRKTESPVVLRVASSKHLARYGYPSFMSSWISDHNCAVFVPMDLNHGVELIKIGRLKSVNVPYYQLLDR